MADDFTELLNDCEADASRVEDYAKALHIVLGTLHGADTDRRTEVLPTVEFLAYELHRYAGNLECAVRNHAERQKTNGGDEEKEQADE